MASTGLIACPAPAITYSPAKPGQVLAVHLPWHLPDVCPDIVGKIATAHNITTVQAEVIWRRLQAVAIEITSTATCDRFMCGCENWAICWDRCGCVPGCGCHVERYNLDPILDGRIGCVTCVYVDGEPLTDATWNQNGKWWMPTSDLIGQLPSTSNLNAETPMLILGVAIGEHPPASVLEAAAQLACELAKQYAGEDCAIPTNLVSLDRDGVSMRFDNTLIGGIALLKQVREDYPCLQRRRLVDPMNYGPAVRVS